jgi:hypothetical protein
MCRELGEVPCGIGLIVQNVDISQFFPCETPTITKINLVLEHSLMTALDVGFSYIIMTVSDIINIAVEKSFNRIYRLHEEPSLYHTLYIEYSTFFNATKKIQQQWRECVSNPEYTVCKQRLTREFEGESFCA